jgi:hypothetical protein
MALRYSHFGTWYFADVIGNLALVSMRAYSRLMRIVGSALLSWLVCAVLLTPAKGATTKAHVITFGKWTSVQWFPGSGTNDKPITIKVRALVIDGRIKEYSLGAPHEVTERLFGVRRAFRVNDSLPEDSAPRWQWERGGWLLVDRLTGHVSPINLPEFDVYYSAASWYRDYVAYCGVAEDGKKTFAMVAQISRRNPVLKKPLSNDVVADDAAPDSACPAPAWQRSPVRVSFGAGRSRRLPFAVMWWTW